jgi:hypothetical protein
MKRYRQQQGVALVITLLMLSVVTFMAVVFLAVSRREKAAVTASADFIDAGLMADAALARAEAEVVTRILSVTNTGAYDLLVSTNYYSAAGFRLQASAIANTTNVNYWTAAQMPPWNLLGPLGAPKPDLAKLDRIQNIANLQYDPRPPVFIRTNQVLAVNNPRAWDFRFFLDLNRNGMFEASGLVSDLKDPRQTTNYVSGDPEWIGVLEHPDRPHSETNRFIGRYAFMALPAGKSLDVNFIHNYAKRLNPAMPANSDSFSRNQGVGSWEMNLAAFLRDLNTNAWPLGSYHYTVNPAGQSFGATFEDATAILRYRYGTNLASLASAETYFGPPAAQGLTRDGINSYSDAPLAVVESDQVKQPWSGSDSTNVFFDAQEFSNPSIFPPSVATKLALVSRFPGSNYDRYTLYRMLEQLGVDSQPALSNRLFQADLHLHPTNKFNLNYQQAVGDVQSRGLAWNPELDWTPAVPGNATAFFLQVADRLLRASLTTNVIATATGRPVSTNFMLGEFPVRNDISVTNIQLFSPPNKAALPWETSVEYTSTLHRILQLAANIYDATTTRRIGTNDYPTVFRPLFGRAANGSIRIVGFTEVTNTIPLLNRWRDLNFPPDRDQIRANDNVYGVPWVIGTKKGLPNFNEFSLETALQVSRKLELRRLSGRLFLTNQMYVLSLSNIFGVEAWNSYARAMSNRPLQLVVSNRFSVALTNIVGNTTNLVLRRTGVVGGVTSITNWLGSANPGSFLLPVHTNLLLITNSAYLSRRPPFFFDSTQTNNFEATLDPPRLYLFMTNRLQYWLIDRSVTPNRIVDFVNLDGLNTFLDVTQALLGDQTAGGGGYFRDNTAISDSGLWLTNRAGTAPNTPTLGILNQMAVSVGDPRVAADVWRSHASSVSPDQKEAEIEAFQRFLRGQGTNLIVQAPFTPTRKIYQRLTWQANDPLVHYTMGDLTDPFLSNPNATNNYAIIRPAFTPLPSSNLGMVNDRYQPWGGNPQKQATGLAFAMTVKDPLVRSSDDWTFPTNKFPNIGWLGRVHRGTPWQTVYLKSHIDPLTGHPVTPREWLFWAGSLGTHPTNDWKLLDLFTTAPNANATRGLLSVNQTNTAAWSAVLSGVHLLSNSVINPGPITGMRFADVYADAGSRQVQTIVNGINQTRNQMPGRLFRNFGDVLASPELTVRSPFLNTRTPQQIQRGLTDEVVERIPQQILSLLKADEPRIVVYAFGQSLKPAERSIVTSGNFYNICTNYQITAEVVTKAVLRIEDAPAKPKIVVESYNVLPAE